MGWRPSDRPVLCLVVDRGSTRHPLDRAVRAAVGSGVDWVQLRDRELEGGALLAWCRELAACAGRATVLVNRRLDVALCLAGHRAERVGVHLGFDAVAPEDAAALLDAGAPIGVSAHSAFEVAAAASAGAHYAHLAPVFAPLSKPATRPALGTAPLGEAARAGIPVLAQGGITAENAGVVVRAGAAGVAVTGAILGATDPAAGAASLRRALDAARGPGAPRGGGVARAGHP